MTARRRSIMSKKLENEVAQGSAESVSALTATQELVRKARRYHRLRFWRQFWFWSAVILAAAFCWPAESLLVAMQDPVCRGLQACAIAPNQILNALPVLFLVLFAAFHLAKEYQSGIDWRDAVSRVGSLAKHEVVTLGFADFFDIYIRSKRRSYQLLVTGLLALAYGAVGGWQAARAGFLFGSFGIVTVLELMLGCVLLAMSYRIARGYLPGQIVAENTLLLCTIALQKDINIAEAREIVAKDISQFVERKPWWFYN